MAVRTTSTEVKQILDGCILDGTVIDVFIAAASRLIDSVYAADTTMSDAQLEDIETWLSAHMIASTIHRQTSQEEVDGASVKYTGYWSKDLESTSYGQMVKMLDISGKMANVGKKEAKMTAITSFE